MATRGYNSYRGRGGNKKAIIAIALVLILLGAIGFLIVQNYMVYDDAGNAHLELPFLQKDDPAEVSEETVPEDVDLEILPPARTRPDVSEIHAAELKYGSLWWNPEYVLTLADDAMLIHVKRPNGGITYDTAVTVPNGITVERGRTIDTLKALLDSDKYAIACISCFCDSGYARANPGAALWKDNGDLWRDEDGYAWLDPASPTTLAYLTELCTECAELGFDEIVLDYFGYPTGGDTASIDGLNGLDKTQILWDFADTLRESLPDTLVISVRLHGSLAKDSGLSAQMLCDAFDRIYLTPNADAAALHSGLPANYDTAARLVSEGFSSPESGSYLLLYSEPAPVEDSTESE